MHLSTKQYFLIGLLFALASVMYWPVVNGFFVSDDFVFLYRIQQSGFVPYSGMFFRPASQLLLWLNYQLWHLNPQPYFIISVCLHLFNTALVFILSKKLSPTFSFYQNYIAALLFMIYPFACETIFWISAQGVLVATSFILLAIICHIKIESSIFRSLCVTLFFGIALLFYESAWCFPLLLIVYDYKVNCLSIKKILQRITPVCGVFILYAIWRWIAVHQFFYDYGSKKSVFESLSLLPSHLLMLVGRSVMVPMQSTVMFVGFSCAILLILFFVFFATQRRNNISNNKPLLFVGLSFFICLFPFITYGINIHNIEEGRYLYLSGIFLVLFLVMLLSKAIPSIANIFICGLAGLCFIFLLNIYGNYWRSAYAITNNYCEEISRTKCDSLIGINVPTDKYGAYIFRNGFEQCTNLFSKIHHAVVYNKAAIPPEKTINSYETNKKKAQTNERAAGEMINDSITVFEKIKLLTIGNDSLYYNTNNIVVFERNKTIILF